MAPQSWANDGTPRQSPSRCSVQEAANADEVIERVEDFDPVQLTKLADASDLGQVWTTCTCPICQFVSFFLIFCSCTSNSSVLIPSYIGLNHGVLHTGASIVLYIARKLNLETQIQQQDVFPMTVR